MSSGAMFKDPAMVAEYDTIALRTTGPFAKPLLQQAGLGHPPDTPLRIFHSACGTGIVGRTLYPMLDDKDRKQLQLTCGDWSEGMVTAMRQRIESEGWQGATAQVIDATVRAFGR